MNHIISHSSGLSALSEIGGKKYGNRENLQVLNAFRFSIAMFAPT